MDSCKSVSVPWSLRPYQLRAGDRIEAAFAKGVRTLCVASPTGSGKTIIAIDQIIRARSRGETVLVMAPRHELIKQLVEKLDEFMPFGYGLIVADRKERGQNLYLPVQVASVDTLISRVIRRQNLVLPPIGLVVIDECHLYQTEQRDKLMQLFPDAKILGFTATPGRHDGRPLGSHFEHLISVASIRQLTEQGFLAPLRYLGPSEPDMQRVKVVMGEWNAKQTAERMAPLLAEIVPTWLKEAPTRRTAVFAQSVEQSIWLAEQFVRNGVTAEHCDGTMDTRMRDDIFERFGTGETQVFCNVDLATYGFDLPELDCVVLAKPTRSIVKYLQMVGRAMRTAPGKKDGLVLDHAGNVRLHGKAHEERYWTLGGEGKTSPRAARKPGERAKKINYLTCPECSAIFTGTLTCECGYYFAKAGKSFRVVDGELVEIGEISKDTPNNVSHIERMRFFCELLHIAKAKGYKQGWASVTYKDRYKEWPPREWATYDPMPPSMETSRYLKYVQIRRAKSKGKKQVEREQQQIEAGAA